jgi:hypothetical protein
MVSGLWFLFSGFSLQVSSFFICVNLRNLRMHLISFKTTDPQIAQIYADEAADQEFRVLP